MMTVHEVSQLAGISVRTLHHYDSIGLLSPNARTEAGYRLYDEECLARLQQILLFRELEFSLKDIKVIMSSPGFDRTKAIDQQIRLLELKRDHIDRLLLMARQMRDGEVSSMSFEPFDDATLRQYAEEARQSWGSTPEWKEYERRSEGRTMEDEQAMGAELMSLFKPFAQMAEAGVSPKSDEAKAQAKRIQAFISDHYYACPDEVFLQLGRAYGCGGDFTRNIDSAAGSGAAEFAMHAIEACFAP